MKISYESNSACHKTLGDLSPGTPFTFKDAKHQHNNVFIVNEVCASYDPASHWHRYSENFFGKMACTNLRTGALAWEQKSHPVYPVESEVCVYTNERKES